MFGAAARRERRLIRLQERADAGAARARALARAGRTEDALAPSREAVDLLSQLRELEPDEEEHLDRLATALYEHAGMLARAGRSSEAILAARRCLDCHLEQTGGEIAPPELLGLEPPHHRRADLPELAAGTADARSRLASLLARSGDAAVAGEARRLGREAVETYELLVRLDADHYQDDHTRVLAAFLAICRRTAGED